MARILDCCDGAELNDLSFWDAVSSSVSASAAEKFSGSYSYLLGSNAWAVKDLPTAKSTIYLRFRFFYDTLETAEFPFLRLRYESNNMLAAKINPTTGHVNLYTSNGGTDTLLHAGSMSLQQETWYMLEFQIIIDDASGAFAHRVDCIDDTTGTGDTKTAGESLVNNFLITAGASNTQIYVDDIAVDDAAWCGDGRYIVLRPNGNGDTSQWTGSDGNSTDNYLLVDDTTPDDDATYVEDSTTGHQDMYHIEDFDGTGKTILRVWVDSRAKSSEATGEQIKLGVKSGTTTDLSTAKDLANSYRRVIGSDYTTNPDTAAAWTDGDLDGLQIVIETV